MYVNTAPAPPARSAPRKSTMVRRSILAMMGGGGGGGGGGLLVPSLRVELDAFLFRAVTSGRFLR